MLKVRIRRVNAPPNRGKTMVDTSRPIFGVVKGGAGKPLPKPEAQPVSSASRNSQFLGKRCRTHLPETITPVAWACPETAGMWCVGVYYERWEAHTHTFLQQSPAEISLRFIEMTDNFEDAMLKANRLAQEKVYSQLYEIGLDAREVTKDIDALPFTPPSYGTPKPKFTLVIQ